MQRTRGFTLIEVMLVIVVLALLIGLLIPAVGRMREAASRASCQNHLKEISTAIHAYHNSNLELPNTRRLTTANIRTSWVIRILPYLEHGDLASRYQLTREWDSQANRVVVSTRLKLLECPSNPNVGLLDGSPNTSPPWEPPFAPSADYAASMGVWSASKGIATNGALPWNVPLKLTDIVDGASNTVILVECAGRPLLYQAGSLVGPYSATVRVNGGGWARPASDYQLIGSTPDGLTFPGTCAINCTTGPDCGPGMYPHPVFRLDPTTQMYAFHVGGANVLLCDGAVRFINQSITVDNFRALVTRNGSEIVTGLD